MNLRIGLQGVIMWAHVSDQGPLCWGGNVMVPMPKGWSRATLGEIARPTRPHVEPSTYPFLPFVGLEHLEADTMRLLGSASARTVSSLCTKFEAGDILYARMRPNLNKVWLAEWEGVCSGEFIVLPASADLDNRFLAYRLNAVDFVGFAVAQAAGDRPRVSFDQIALFELALPPLAEQRRVVAKLESKLRHVREGVAFVHRARARVVRYRRAIVAAAVTGRLRTEPNRADADGPRSDEVLTDLLHQRSAKIGAVGRRRTEPSAPDTANVPSIPTAWSWVSVDQLAWGSGYGTSVKCSYQGKGPAVLRIPNVKDGRIDWSDVKFAIGGVPVGEGDSIAPGDLLVIRTNGSKELIGRAAMTLELPASATGFASYLIRFRLSGEPLIWKWIALVWNSPPFRPLLEHLARTTAGQYNLSLSSLRSFALPLPPLSGISAILTEVGRRLASADRLAERIEKQLGSAREQRQALVQGAFAGDFVEQDPTDEPAYLQIERLRAGRDREIQAVKEGKMQPEGKGRSLTRKTILDVLSEHGEPMSPDDLFRAAGFHALFRKTNYDQSVVDQFYAELQVLLQRTPGIREVRPDENTVLLEAAL
jgi:type I restriction enzyme, S subunit